MTSGRECSQNCNRGSCRTSHLREGRTGVADLAGEEVVLVAKLDAADWMDVAEFVQHRALLSKDQQQGKNQCKANSGSIHGLAKNGSPETTTTPKSSI
jgi:superfamily II DNA/RNA helicase